MTRNQVLSTLRERMWRKRFAGGSSLPWATFTGNPLQFRAQKAHTLKSTSVAFTPKQEGTGDPSPDNVRPISGRNSIDVMRAGENLLPTSLPNNAINAQLGSTTITSAGNAYVFAVPVPKNTAITVQKKSDDSKGGYLGLGDTGDIEIGTPFYDGKGFTGGTLQTFSTGNHGWLYVQGPNQADTEAYFTTRELMVSVGSARKEYVAPSPISTTTLTFGTTVFGGNASVAEDGSVDLVGEWVSVDPSTLSFVLKNNTANRQAWEAVISDLKPVTNSNTPPNALLSEFKPVSQNDTWLPYCVAPNHTGGSEYPNLVFCFPPNAYASEAEIKTAISGVQLVYELAEPVTYHLPSLAEAIRCFKGINIVWSDANGDVTVEARAEAVNLSALQSLNMLLGGRYVNNHTDEDLTDEEALSILLGGEK